MENKKVDKKVIKEKSGKIIKEFKVFISKGNALDLAVGVIIGSAFGKIVTSIVNDILMPVIGIIIGGHDFSNLIIKIGDATIRYGSFVQNVIDFFIVALCIFVFIKLINIFNKKEEETKKKKDEQIVLLEEIRDLLKNNK